MKKCIVIVALALLASPAAAQDMPLSQVLIDGQGWRPFAKGFKSIQGLTTDKQGHVYVTDADSPTLFLVEEQAGKKSFADVSAKPGGLTFGGANGHFYMSLPGKPALRSFDGQGKVGWEAMLPAVAQGLAVTRKDGVYFSVPEEKAVYLIEKEGKPRKVAEGIGKPTGLLLAPDQGTLVVADAAGKHLYSFRVEKDGALTCKEGYHTLRLPAGQKASGAEGMVFDNAGRLYVATAVGVQCFDPTGRMNGVLLNPSAMPPTAIAFGGADGDQLYIACGDQIFVRTTKAKCAYAVEKPK